MSSGIIETEDYAQAELYRVDFAAQMQYFIV